MSELKTKIMIREFFVSNFNINIIVLKKESEYIWIKNSIIWRFICCLLFIIPFFILTKIITYFGYEIIYKKENLYYITGVTENKITPIVLEFKAYCTDDSYIDTDLRPYIKYYNSSIPFVVFSELNIPNYYDMIKIMFMFKGRIYEKSIAISECTHFFIYNLFDLPI